MKKKKEKENEIKKSVNFQFSFAFDRYTPILFEIHPPGNVLFPCILTYVYVKLRYIAE